MAIDFEQLAALLTEAPRDVTAARRDVERLDALLRLAHRDDGFEIVALHMCRGRAIRLGAGAPEVAHAASSTARRAASSIVGST